MPRLKHATFLAQRRQLMAAWEDGQRRFAHLSLSDQRVLHDFYRPPESLTDKQLVEHRRHIKRTDKSLANRAGKAHVRFARGEVDVGYQATLPSGRVVTAHPVLRPQPDMELLVKALIETARQTARDESDDDSLTAA